MWSRSPIQPWHPENPLLAEWTLHGRLVGGWVTVPGVDVPALVVTVYAHSSIEGSVSAARDANRAFLTHLFEELAGWHQHPVLMVGDTNLDVSDPWYYTLLEHFVDLQYHYAPSAEGAYPTCFSSPENPSRIDV
eukprot:873283-Amphidinium_carterae.1